MTDPRRSQAIQAAFRELNGFRIPAAERADLAESIVDAVLAVPPAEPQEGEPTRLCGRCKSSVGTTLNALRLKRCAECGEPTIPLEVRTIRTVSAPVQSSPDPVRAEEVGSVIADMTEARDIHARWIEVLGARHEDGSPPGPVGPTGDAAWHRQWVERYERCLRVLGSVREPGPRYDVRVASLLDTEVQRLATLADETEGPAAERFVRQARYVSGVLDDVVERRESGPNVVEEKR